MLFDLRIETRDRGVRDWAFAGDVAVSVRQVGSAPALADALFAAYEQKDKRLLKQTLFPQPINLVDEDAFDNWPSAGRVYWQPDHLHAHGPTGSRLSFSYQLNLPYETAFGAWRKHRDPVKHAAQTEFFVHSEWPYYWDQSLNSLLPRLYRVALEADSTGPAHAHTDWQSRFDASFDYYAFWIALDAHSEFVRNLAVAWWASGSGYDPQSLPRRGRYG